MKLVFQLYLYHYYIILLLMQPKDLVTHVIPPCPKTIRGETSFIEASPTHLLYFNGCTVILRPIDHSSCLFINHNCNVVAVKFSYGYKHIASIDEKGTLMIHIVHEKNLVISKTYEGCFAGAKSIDWTSDNKRICIVGSGKNKFGRVINVDTGTDLGEVSAVSANLTTCSFRSQKPYKLAVGGQEYIVKFYQGPPYKFICSKKSHTNFINQIKYSPDGKRFVSVSSDRKIVLYDGLTGQIQKQLANAHEGGIMGVAWIDNQSFVTGSSDKKLKKWNLYLQLLAELKSATDQHQFGLLDSFIVALTYDPQRSALYFVLLSGEIKQTDKNLTAIIKSYEGYRNKPIKILPLQGQKDSALLLDNNGKFLKINVKNNQVHRYHRKMLCYNKMLIDFCLTSQGIAYILTAEDQIFEVDTKSAAQPEKIQFAKAQGTQFISALNKLKGFVGFTRDYVRIYVQREGKFQKVGEQKLLNEPTAVFTDQKFAFVGNAKGKVQIFQIQTSGQSIKIAKVTQFQSNMNKVTSIYRHNNILFTGDSMGSIKVYKFSSEDSEPQKISDNMGSHTTQITSITVKNNHIYTFSLDNKYSLWKLENYSRITTFNEVHRHGIIYAEIVGDHIVTCGGDLLIKVHQL